MNLHFIFCLLILGTLNAVIDADITKKIDAIENAAANDYVKTIQAIWKNQGHSLYHKVRYVGSYFPKRHNTEFNFKSTQKLINSLKEEFYSTSKKEQKNIICKAFNINPDELQFGTEAYALYSLLNSDYQEEYNDDYVWHFNKKPFYENLQEKIDQYNKAKVQQSRSSDAIKAYQYSMLKKTIATAICGTIIFLSAKFLYKKYCEYKNKWTKKAGTA